MITTGEISTPELARRIIGVLSSRRGRARAITAAEIAKRIGLNDPGGTGVRAILARELELCPEPVLAGGNGYFLIETGEEAAQYLATLMSRLRKIGRRIQVTRRKLLADGWQFEGGKWIPPAPQARLATLRNRLFDDSPTGFNPPGKPARRGGRGVTT